MWARPRLHLRSGVCTRSLRLCRQAPLETGSPRYPGQDLAEEQDVVAPPGCSPAGGRRREGTRAAIHLVKPHHEVHGAATGRRISNSVKGGSGFPHASILLNPQISAAIEQACERTVAGMMEDPDREPWEILSEKIVTVLPPGVAPLLETIDREPLRPKSDPLAPFAPNPKRWVSARSSRRRAITATARRC